MSAIEARLERIARLFGLHPQPYDPEATLAWEGPGTWERLAGIAWLMMFASWAASATLSGDPPLLGFLGLLLATAFVVARWLHRRPTSRLLVNWLSFGGALVTSPLLVARHWPFSEGFLAADSLQSMTFLILCFLWITVFRAFALRTVRDLVQTILPCGSIILLVLIINAQSPVLACMALTVLCTLLLLAGEQRLEKRAIYSSPRVLNYARQSRLASTLYSWPMLYGFVLVASILTAWAAARAELSGEWADYVRYALARQLMRWMIPREHAVMPERSLFLPRLESWPDSERPVFHVHTKHPGNYRLNVYHTYTGIWWQPSRHMRLQLAQRHGDAWLVPLAGSGASRARAIRIEQTFVLQKAFVGVLPALYCPVSVTVRRQRVRYDRDRLLHISLFLRPGDRFRVVSYVQPLVPWPRADTKIAPDEIAEDLQLPTNLPARVRTLAEEWARDAPTPFEKARAIEEQLRRHYKYRLSVQSSYPYDFVDYFLFESRRGFCVHFASAMVVLCRVIGLPARLVSGFLPGDEDPKTPDLYIVRERHAHAWAEVYFPGAGWIAFDPTPPAEEQESGLAKAWEQLTTALQTTGIAVWQSCKRYGPTLLATLGLLALSAGLWRWERQLRQRRRWRQASPAQRISQAYLQLRRLMAKHGLCNRPSLAPREWLALLPQEWTELRQEAERFIEKYLFVRFGHPTREQAETLSKEAEERLRRIATQLRRCPHASRSPQ